jgi:hypothetical protein
MARSELFAILFLVGCASGPATSSGPPVNGATPDQRAQLRDPIVAAQLRVLTFGVSAHDGALAPSTMVSVAASDHQAAESVISGAIIGDHVPVFVVQATGGPFTARHAPPGVAAPTGEVLTVTYDAATLAVTDVGLDDEAPDLARIDGDVVDLMAP